jgi:hypothetical protein
MGNDVDAAAFKAAAWSEGDHADQQRPGDT